jgi:hypothetical protein
LPSHGRHFQINYSDFQRTYHHMIPGFACKHCVSNASVKTNCPVRASNMAPREYRSGALPLETARSTLSAITIIIIQFNSCLFTCKLSTPEANYKVSTST